MSHVVRAAALAALAGVAAPPAVVQAQGHADTARLVVPPAVPAALGRARPGRVVVQLEARELVGELAEGVQYTFWTYDGQVPGRLIRVREGDVVEFHLRNHPDSRMPHNIDVHAAAGPGGGASASLAAPGDEASFEFRATRPGLYVYHCATAPVGMHIANGMYGLLLVEPSAGLPPTEREYYLMLGEFYTDGAPGETGLRTFSMEKALAEQPDYVVFNGHAGALTGAQALTARVGERVRLFLGNGGPNLTASFHGTGVLFDRVLPDGVEPATAAMQAVSLPPGGAAIVEWRPEVPGTYTLADHAVFRAFNKGALAQLRVEGVGGEAVFAGASEEDVYHPEGAVIQLVPARTDSAAPELTLEERIEAGRRVFQQTCRACHQADGAGVAGSFPPLAGSDFLNADVRRAVRIVLEGFEGPILVNGRLFNAVMPALRLSDDDVANVLTYVYGQWGNSGTVVTRALVREIRICPWCEETRR